jgi:hypothetical protein
LQSSGELAAKLVEGITAFFRGSSVSEFRFLTHDPNRQSNQDSGWNENRQNEQEDSAIAPAIIVLIHGDILDRKVNRYCHEIVW